MRTNSCIVKLANYFWWRLGLRENNSLIENLMRHEYKLGISNFPSFCYNLSIEIIIIILALQWHVSVLPIKRIKKKRLIINVFTSSIRWIIFYFRLAAELSTKKSREWYAEIWINRWKKGKSMIIVLRGTTLFFKKRWKPFPMQRKTFFIVCFPLCLCLCYHLIESKKDNSGLRFKDFNIFFLGFFPKTI